MDEITTFLMTFEKEVNTYQRLISEKKEELKLHTADNKSLKQLGVYEQEVSDLKIFINLVNNDMNLKNLDISYKRLNTNLKQVLPQKNKPLIFIPDFLHEVGCI